MDDNGILRMTNAFHMCPHPCNDEKNFLIHLSSERFYMKPQHDSDHLASSLQISAIIGYEVHHKTTNDHTLDTKRSATA